LSCRRQPSRARARGSPNRRDLAMAGNKVAPMNLGEDLLDVNAEDEGGA
jgi:hypothetical protein